MLQDGLLELLAEQLPKHLKPLIPAIRQYYTSSSALVKEDFPKLFFTWNGCMEFLEKGSVAGGIVDSLSIPTEYRSGMLQQFVQTIQSGVCQGRLLIESEFALKLPIILEIWESKQVSLFIRTSNKCLFYFSLNEPSICEALLDFMEHLEAIRLASTEKETLEKLQEICQPKETERRLL